MSTPNRSILHSEPLPHREGLRLRMAEHPGHNQVDGGWWPHSRDLAVELADLVDHFPPRLGRIVRALVSPPDWDLIPRRIPVAGRYLKVGGFPHDDSHLIHLTTTEHTLLYVLVVPPGLAAAPARRALISASSGDPAQTATDVLAAAANPATGSDDDHWNDDGGAWWDPHPVAPSARSGG